MTKIQNPAVLHTMWSQADFDILQRRFPNDYRPSLYRGLYLMSIYKLNAESDCTPVLDAFRLAATLNPASPLPEFFIGELYSPIGATDESQRSAVRSLTAAIALDPKFGPAYALRAEAFSNLKEYRQAIRDYGKVLELTPTQKATEVAYSDRGLAKLESGEYQSAIEDFTQAIAIGCKAEWCNSSFSHFHRAEAYMKLHDYRRAVEDFTASIKTDLSYGLLLMNIDKFRQIYPEYDSVPDDSLCEKVRALFFPGMRYSDFAKEFLIGAKTYSPPTILTESYVRRGDAYSALNRMRKANVEYDRISRAFPDDVKFWFVDVKGKRVRRPQ
ncbi:MAG TPA: tetratricopeptide repeat protein [Candidatus Sulfotelmatobacter sp.]|nr:tetratricopeptide repeat protein [Candidatus Sulfotelmatobacter sp.]